jgi:ferritin-like metal-binding protein YciE
VTGEAKIVQYLNEAHAMEVAGVQTLTAHVAMTPRGEYRDLLETHLAETREQAQRIERRLADLGESRNPIQQVYGVAQNAVTSALSLTKAPIDLLRGSGGEEKLHKNAKDELTNEALEIGTYDGLEATATALGDERTAVLARGIRGQEERTFARLRELIPTLARAVVAAEVDGAPSFDVTTTGTADAVRGVAARGQQAVGDVQAGATQTAGEVAAAARAAAADVQDAAAATAGQAVGTAGQAIGTAGQVAGDVAAAAGTAAADAGQAVASSVDTAGETVEQAAERATRRAANTARAIPGEAEIEGEIRGAGASASDLAIADYDGLTVEQILPKLKLLPELELAKVDAYEREHRNRKRVLDRVRKLREGTPAGARS